MVPPAAQPVVAFYINNSKNNSLSNSYIYIWFDVLKIKPMKLLKTIFGSSFLFFFLEPTLDNIQMMVTSDFNVTFS